MMIVSIATESLDNGAVWIPARIGGGCSPDGFHVEHPASKIHPSVKVIRLNAIILTFSNHSLVEQQQNQGQGSQALLH